MKEMTKKGKKKMEDNIEINEYIRNNKGNIGKVIDIFNGHSLAKYHIEYKVVAKVKRQWLSTKTIIKHSPNIIDLIQERRLCKWKTNS